MHGRPSPPSSYKDQQLDSYPQTNCSGSSGGYLQNFSNTVEQKNPRIPIPQKEGRQLHCACLTPSPKLALLNAERELHSWRESSSGKGKQSKGPRGLRRSGALRADTETGRHGESGLRGAVSELGRERLRGLSPGERLSCRPGGAPQAPPAPAHRQARSRHQPPSPVLLSPPSLSGARQPHQQPLQASGAVSQALQDAASLMPVSSLRCLHTQHCAAWEGSQRPGPRSAVAARVRHACGHCRRHCARGTGPPRASTGRM